MKRHTVMVYAGDGIGVDVTIEAVNVLKIMATRCGFELKMTELDWGHRYWRKTGKVAPDDYLKQLQQCDAVLLGALGDPANVPDHESIRPLIEMRQAFDQYANVRPAKLFPGLRSPLADRKPEDIDIVVVRENSEGEYISAGGFFKRETPDGIALQTAIHTRKGVERILRFGFEWAQKRVRKKLTMVTKSNALKIGMVFWDEVLEVVRKDYPTVQTDKCHIDAMCMALVQKPQNYDVVVCSNMFGDIISDITGAIAGSIGLSPSANLNPEHTFPSLFEPVHGSAPDIAGKGIANPLAAIRSAAMMLEFLGEMDAAMLIEKAVFECVVEGAVRTPDMGGQATTAEVGADVRRRLAAP